MATYREQLEYVDTLRINAGVRTRFDCPFCGGRNSFGLTHRGLDITWHCFRASCDVAGIKSVEGSPDTIRSRLAGRTAFADVGRTYKPIPSILTSITKSDRATAYVEKVHAMPAFTVGDISLTYSPADDRVLFHDPASEFAVGRALGKSSLRWLKYGKPPAMFSIGSGTVAAIVEDAASACAVSQVPDLRGCALLGTTLTDLNLSWLLKHTTKVIVALDQDASRQSLSIKRKLDGLVETSVIFLDRDLKDMAVGPMTAKLKESGML